MTHTLSPSLLDVDGRLIESYNRVSHATDKTKEDLGLSTEEPIFAHVAVAPIEEFLILQAKDLSLRSTKTWSLDRLEQAVKIESVYIDSPNADAILFEVLAGDSVVFTFNLNRNKTPYDFPENPLDSGLKIRVKAKASINLLRIVLKPVVILETFLPDGESLSNSIPETER